MAGNPVRLPRRFIQVESSIFNLSHDVVASQYRERKSFADFECCGCRGTIRTRGTGGTERRYDFLFFMNNGPGWNNHGNWEY